ncbi:hypothetical protein Aple_054880 [Acrocarpospora pleiomorpha]|uniref:Major facilitator superfamily (MFS) profile domain-containing protein n=2 Tax=Acrocarpospora pleiomorpha TaxID=90975 RepID=A0A5M3XNS5_9ACTN|nr:DHA2 family efflux MFS transporter permease subunit [Acrocarpospora pleiomorpha]GES22590.1 hypothetical protein Aple_054880 [Acrocarpospora pleiomorpha]
MYRWRWAALFVILAAEVMDVLDALVTTIAAPAIRADLGGGASLMQWLGAGYALAMAVGLITGGRLGDLYGRRRMFLIGALGFTAASVLCGLAQSPEMLVGSRVLQGLFGAVLIPQGLGLIKEMFPPKEMATAMGAFGPVIALGSVGGPVLAGWLVDADFFGTGWRMIFLINLPVGLAAFSAALVFLPESRSAHASRLDVTGMGLVTAASFLLIYPLIQGRELDWPVWTFASMAASVLVFAVFARHQIGKQRAGRDPLVVPELFRKRAFTAGLVAGLLFFAGMIGFSLVWSVYTQAALGYTPLQAGLAALPMAVGTIFGFAIGGAGLAAKLGRTAVQLGALVMGAGVVVAGYIVTSAGAGITAWQFGPPLFAAGIGLGLFMMPFFDIVLAGVEEQETGSASGTLTAVQQLGGAFGTALLGTVFFGRFDGTASAVLVTVGMAGALMAVSLVVAFLMPRKAVHVS